MHFMQSITLELSLAFNSVLPDHIYSYSFKSSRLDAFDFQCNDSMSVATKAGIPAKELALSVADKLRASGSFDEATVSGPGFINVRLSNGFILSQLATMHDNPTQAVSLAGSGHRVVLDYGGPNVAKSLHVGHLRSFVIGESLRRILIETGHEVVADIHLGDWGLQMGMLLSSVMSQYPAITLGTVDTDLVGFTVEGLAQLYVEASNACKNDVETLNSARYLTMRLQSGDELLRAIWLHMRAISLSSVSQQIEILNAHFDLFLGESDAHNDIEPMIEDLLVQGIAEVDNGAVVAFHSNNEPPLLLRKSDGAAIYGSTDLAALRDRIENLKATKIVYVVDQRQSQHLEAVFKVAKLAGYANNVELTHAGFGTVNGSDGKPFKTRDGGVAKLADLIDEAVEKASERLSVNDPHVAEMVGVAALKFADLSTDRLSGYVFDPDRMTSFEGKTGPYLQYACARINAVMDKAGVMGIEARPMAISHPSERQLALSLLGLPVSVANAATSLQPKEVADRAWLIAQAFSRFYTDCPVISAGDTAPGRLALCEATSISLRKCLWLLGIEAPKQM